MISSIIQETVVKEGGKVEVLLSELTVGASTQ